MWNAMWNPSGTLFLWRDSLLTTFKKHLQNYIYLQNDNASGLGKRQKLSILKVTLYANENAGKKPARAGKTYIRNWLTHLKDIFIYIPQDKLLQLAFEENAIRYYFQVVRECVKL